MGKNGEDKIGAVTFRKIKKNRRMLFLRGPVGLFIFLRNDFFFTIPEHFHESIDGFKEF